MAADHCAFAHRVRRAIVAVLLAGAGMVCEAQTSRDTSSLLQPNLVVNGSFEDWTGEQPAGWQTTVRGGSCTADSQAGGVGSQALRLDLPIGGGSVSVSQVIAPVAAGWYFCRFLLAVEGLSKSGSFEGGQADLVLVWLNAQQQVLSRDYIHYSYGPTVLAYHDLICRAPDGTTAVNVLAGAHGSDQVQLTTAAWFDDIALCRYLPPDDVSDEVAAQWSVSDGRNIFQVPEATAWFYVPGDGHDSVQAKRVRDADALAGWAMETQAGAPPGMIYHSPYTLEQPAGLYRVFVRLSCPEVSASTPLCAVDVISSHSGRRAAHRVSAGQLTDKAGYQDFWFDFVKPAGGWIAVRAMLEQDAPVFRLDHLRVVQLAHFTDPQLLSWYPGTAAALGPQPTLAAAEPIRCLLVRGLHCQRMQVAQAAAQCGWTVDTATFGMGQSGPILTDYPPDWAALRTYRVVIFANAGIAGLTPQQRYQLRMFVEAGGGLLLTGGKAAYGNGGLRDSFIADLLPVLPAATRFDLQQTLATVSLTTPSGAAAGITGLLCPWLHRVQLTANGTVQATVGDLPLLVTGSAGSGRVACLLAAPYGAARDDAELLFDWDGFSGYLGAWLAWLAQQ